MFQAENTVRENFLSKGRAWHFGNREKINMPTSNARESNIR